MPDDRIGRGSVAWRRKEDEKRISTGEAILGLSEKPSFSSGRRKRSIARSSLRKTGRKKGPGEKTLRTISRGRSDSQH